MIAFAASANAAAVQAEYSLPLLCFDLRYGPSTTAAKAWFRVNFSTSKLTTCEALRLSPPNLRKTRLLHGRHQFRRTHDRKRHEVPFGAQG